MAVDVTPIHAKERNHRIQFAIRQYDIFRERSRYWRASAGLATNEDEIRSHLEKSLHFIQRMEECNEIIDALRRQA